MLAVILIAKICLVFSVTVLTLYAIRHYVFAMSRLFLKHPREWMEFTGFMLPRTTVLVAMHNEETVAADVLQALVECDYDWEKLEILAIDDRSSDRTGAIIDEFAAKYPVIKAVHRESGEGGKGGALQFATPLATGEVLLLFDADYFPGRAMIKQLVAPFCDPQIGAVMGRVVPHNTGRTLLTELLSMERAAGYQVGQQARYNMGLTPQFGGTVGGVRATALRAVGGWNPESLTEDTDLTFRLVVRGWKVAYANRAECYEEVPETWEVRRRQIARWATGHTDCLHRLQSSVIRSSALSFFGKVDALFVLGCYLTAPVLVLGWLASLVLFFSPQAHYVPALAIALTFAGYQMFGNQATFYELGVAALLDGAARRVLLMPLNLFNFFASTGAICRALFRYYTGKLSGTGGPRWQKTRRYRENGNGKGFANGNGAPNGLYSQGANGLYTCRTTNV
ncbi:MAG TPA: glycosyltransferase [Bryobacteraceae bacterium]|nr:glycosyltransferase [Bryobacteraceae bacterium]